MCITKTPSIPKPKPLQEAKTPNSVDMLSKRKQRQAGMTGGTILTSPSGVAAGAMNTGANTLLGG